MHLTTTTHWCLTKLLVFQSPPLKHLRLRRRVHQLQLKVLPPVVVVLIRVPVIQHVLKPKRVLGDQQIQLKPRAVVPWLLELNLSWSHPLFNQSLPVVEPSFQHGLRVVGERAL